MTGSQYRWTCTVLSIIALIGVFLCALVDDTPDVWLFASLITASGVFAILAPGWWDRP